jgi:hypothetical protein
MLCTLLNNVISVFGFTPYTLVSVQVDQALSTSINAANIEATLLVFHHRMKAQNKNGAFIFY